MSPEMPLRRQVFVLVVAGAALGIAHNSLGLASRPPRGIPWLAVKAALPRLEDLVPADSAAVSSGDTLRGDDGGAEPSGVLRASEEADRQPAAREAGRAPDGGGAGPGATAATAGREPPPVRGDDARPGGEGTPAPSPPPRTAALPQPRAAVPLPFIPPSDQPIDVQVTTAKRFFDARAALFLDAREAAEYEKGHIPGAIRLTNAEAQNDPGRMNALPVAGRPIIAYCEGGTCEASLELARFLIESGFTKVLVYMGGFPEWAAAGHPVEVGGGQ